MALHPRIENFRDALPQLIIDSEGLRQSESLYCKNNPSEAVITTQHVTAIIIIFILYFNNNLEIF